MIAKFDRAQISSINSVQSINPNRNNALASTGKVAVPPKETFKHVFNNAKKGNEFAAVLLDEWHRHCSPADDSEQQVLQLINKAIDKIFK